LKGILMSKKHDAPPRGNADGRLLSLVERIERLEEEKRAIAEDITCVKQEAKSAGYEVKIINQMIRERRMTEEARQEALALAEIYRAALGMLNGTPLGEFARKRFEPPAPEPEKPRGDDAGDAGADPAPEPAVPEPPVDLEGARTQGAAAMAGGKKITENPFAFGDPRRAAWDEGFCAEAGSDGMEIPDAWRRKAKKAEPGKTP